MPEFSKRFYIAGSFIAILAIAGLAALSFVERAPADPHPPTGWAGPAVVADAAPLVATMPEFELIYPEIDGRTVRQDNTRRRVVLWDHMRKVNGGQHLTNTRQQIGDCVSWGWRNGVSYLLAVAVATGQAAEFEDVYPPYIYGTSRVQVGGGRLGNSDGSIGAWAAKAVQDYGVLSVEAQGVPPYSGSVAKQWGRNGAPGNFITIAKEFSVKTVSPIRTPEDARDAICNGYPIPICSNFGSNSFDTRDGRVVARGNGSWNHCMCLIGYDGSASQPYFYCLNSWGSNMHPAPLNGEPPGGFWITWKQAAYILKQGDSFAVSNFAGFKARDIDFHLIREVKNELGNRSNWIGLESGMPHGGGDDVRLSIGSAGHGRGADLLFVGGRCSGRHDAIGFDAIFRLDRNDGFGRDARGFQASGEILSPRGFLHAGKLSAVQKMGGGDRPEADQQRMDGDARSNRGTDGARPDCGYDGQSLTRTGMRDRGYACIRQDRRWEAGSRDVRQTRFVAA